MEAALVAEALGEEKADTRTWEFTSQLYCKESVTNTVFAQPPCSNKRGQRTPNSADGIFRSGGNLLTLEPTRSGAGYLATFDVGLKLG